MGENLRAVVGYDLAFGFPEIPYKLTLVAKIGTLEESGESCEAVANFVVGALKVPVAIRILGVVVIEVAGQMSAIGLIVLAGDELPVALEVLTEPYGGVHSPDTIGVGNARDGFGGGHGGIVAKSLVGGDGTHLAVAVKDADLRTVGQFASKAARGEVGALAAERIIIGNDAAGALVVDR